MKRFQFFLLNSIHLWRATRNLRDHDQSDDEEVNDKNKNISKKKKAIKCSDQKSKKSTKSCSNPFPLMDLPEDLIFIILSKLNRRDLENVSMCSKTLKSYINSNFNRFPSHPVMGLIFIQKRNTTTIKKRSMLTTDSIPLLEIVRENQDLDEISGFLRNVNINYLLTKKINSKFLKILTYHGKTQKLRIKRLVIFDTKNISIHDISSLCESTNVEELILVGCVFHFKDDSKGLFKGVNTIEVQFVNMTSPIPFMKLLDSSNIPHYVFNFAKFQGTLVDQKFMFNKLILHYLMAWQNGDAFFKWFILKNFDEKIDFGFTKKHVLIIPDNYLDNNHFSLGNPSGKSGVFHMLKNVTVFAV